MGQGHNYYFITVGTYLILSIVIFRDLCHYFCNPISVIPFYYQDIAVLHRVCMTFEIIIMVINMVFLELYWFDDNAIQSGGEVIGHFLRKKDIIIIDTVVLSISYSIIIGCNILLYNKTYNEVCVASNSSGTESTIDNNSLVLSDSTLLPLSIKYDECVICLDPIGGEVVILKCLHLFHKQCIDDWKKSLASLSRSHYTCPICRQSNDL